MKKRRRQHWQTFIMKTSDKQYQCYVLNSFNEKSGKLSKNLAYAIKHRIGNKLTVGECNFLAGTTLQNNIDQLSYYIHQMYNKTE